MARNQLVWAALAATLLAPSALASVGYEGDGESMDLTNPAEYVTLALDLPGYLAVPVPDAPNPVTLAVDAADQFGLQLGSTDARGFTPDAPGNVPAPTFPVVWFPGLMDEEEVHLQYLLTFEEDSAAVLGATDDTRDQVRRRAGLQVERPDWERVPRALLSVDAPGLRVGAAIDSDASASTDGTGSRPRLAERPVALLGTAGVPKGEEFALPLGTSAPVALAGSSSAAPAASPAPVPVLGLAGVAPLGAVPADLALAAGAAAAGLLLGGFALYHLVNRNNIFENDVRMQVYDLVARNPGITIQEVARKVHLSHPTARYHLNVLAKNDLVVFLDKGNKMMFFRNRNEFSEQERELVALLRNPEAMRVYECIEHSPWILRKELSERLGISRTSVNWHLRNLMRAGLLAETREQGKGFLFVRREGREMLLRVIQRIATPALPGAVAPPEAAPVPLGLGHGGQQPA